MYSQSSNQWSLHAELTISHAPNERDRGSGQSHTEKNDNGVRMVYTWNPTDSPSSNNPSSNNPPSVNPLSYGFQRGNMVFTSTPPRPEPNRFNSNVQDSGYGSEHLLTPGSYFPNRRPAVPYNRRCRSTCSIILSTAFNTDGQNIKCDTTAVSQPAYGHCNRTQSLRCQTPSVRNEKRDLFYGCGDPWCYHAEEAPSVRRCSPVFESCEECSVSNQSISSKKPSRANTFSTHFCTTVPERSRSSPPNTRSDMASQTVETREKCTSPFEKFVEGKKEEVKKKIVRRDLRRRSSSSSRHNSDSNASKKVSPAQLPVDSTADSKKLSKRITRTPAVLRGRSPRIEQRKSPPKDATKKPRTVHIDVYCTGSERDSNSSSSTESDVSSPQTVYESLKCRVAHRRAGDSELPFSMSDKKENIPTIVDTSESKPVIEYNKKDNNSDSDENASTCYPSALSSYSTVPDLESSISSVPWSESTCTVLEGYDSVAGTSCKDTVSDFGSFQRKLSLTPAESEYFIPRKLETVDPQPNESRSTIFQSDSFDYEDAEDRDRINKMEHMWGGYNKKNWKSPQCERKYLLQQQKMREFLEKRVKQKGKTSKDTESESADDETEQGWSFVRGGDGKMSIKRDVTVRKAGKDDPDPKQSKVHSVIDSTTVSNIKVNEPKKEDNINKVHLKKLLQAPSNLKVDNITVTPPKIEQSHSTPDIQKINNTKRETIKCIETNKPTNMIKKQIIYDTHLRAPFTIIPGKPTEPLYTAQKFGSILGPMRKPGHHIGPAKNPDCLCEHCRRYYEDYACRNRTKSVGDSPMTGVYNWREILKSRSPNKVAMNYSDF